MTEDQRGRLRKEVRDNQKLHPEIHPRREQAAYNAGKAIEKRERCAAHQGRIAQTKKQLDDLQLELNVGNLEKGLKANGAKITISEMKAQLNWHRRIDTENKIPIKTCINGMKKDDVLVQLIVAVKRYQQGQGNLPMDPNAHDTDSELLSKNVSWEEAEDIEDAAMMEDVLEDHI